MKNKSQDKIFPALVIILLAVGSLSYFVVADSSNYTNSSNDIIIEQPPIVIPDNPNILDTREIGYEYLDNLGNITNETDATVIHIWNARDHYYFNKSSGAQFSNYFNEYWTHNTFCGGFKIDSQWEYKCNDALPFVWNIQTDNSTYVNYTGYKDIARIYNSKTYEIRIAIRYHLKLDDKNLSVQPSVRNIGANDIPVDVGFAWVVNDIKIMNDYEDDKIFINYTNYNLNESLDLFFTNLEDTYYRLHDEAFVQLDWDENLNYKLEIKDVGQNNSRVTLGINGGSLLVGQEKHTTLYWRDPISFDDTVATGSTGDLRDGMSWTHDITCGDNMVLIVGIAVDSEPTATVNSITYNGTSLDLIGRDSTADNEEQAEMWNLTNPDCGVSLPINVTYNNPTAEESAGISAVYYGVDYINLSSLNSSISDGSTSSTLNVESQSSDNWVVNVFALDADAGSGISISGDNAVQRGYSDGGVDTIAVGDGYDSDGTVTIGWSGFNDEWVQIGVELIPAPSVPTFSNMDINDSNVFEGDSVNHSVNISKSPTQYLFSWNASGDNCDTWSNSSWTDVSGESVVGWNVSTIPYSCRDKTIGWKFYANNSVGISESNTESYFINITEEDIQNDDGSALSFYSNIPVGRTYASKFTPVTSGEPYQIRGASIQLYDPNAVGAKEFRIHVYETLGEDLIDPFNVTIDTFYGGWYDVDLSDKGAYINSGSFYIGLEYLTPSGDSGTGGAFILDDGQASPPSNSYSASSPDSSSWSEHGDGDEWMIRASVANLTSPNPQFYNYWDDNASVEGYGVGNFNVSVNDTNGTVFLQIDGNDIVATNLFSNVYNVSYNFTDDGTYSYKWYSWGTGVGDFYNESPSFDYVVNRSYGTLNVSISSPINDSTYSTGDTNLTINVTVTCADGVNAKCGIISASARYNISTSSPDALIPNWAYKNLSKRKPLNFSISSGTTNNNYQMLTYVTYDSDMNSNFSDLKFANIYGNPLSYWIENKSDSNYANIWVESDESISTLNYTYYMYYDNTSIITSESNYVETMVFPPRVLYDTTDTIPLFTRRVQGLDVADDGYLYGGASDSYNTNGHILKIYPNGTILNYTVIDDLPKHTLVNSTAGLIYTSRLGGLWGDSFSIHYTENFTQKCSVSWSDWREQCAEAYMTEDGIICSTTLSSTTDYDSGVMRINNNCGIVDSQSWNLGQQSATGGSYWNTTHFYTTFGYTGASKVDDQVRLIRYKWDSGFVEDYQVNITTNISVTYMESPSYDDEYLYMVGRYLAPNTGIFFYKYYTNGTQVSTINYTEELENYTLSGSNSRLNFVGEDIIMINANYKLGDYYYPAFILLDLNGTLINASYILESPSTVTRISIGNYMDDMSMIMGGSIDNTNNILIAEFKENIDATEYSYVGSEENNTLDFFTSENQLSTPQELTIGQSYQFNFSINISTASSESYKLDVLFNSSYGNSLVSSNNTEDRQVNLNPSVEDTTNPTYSNNQTNNTVVSESTLFSISWDDNSALHPNGTYIFSTNNTGTWVNESAINFTTTPSWANVTKTLNDTVGISIGWRWYTDDNAGNINNTEIFTLTTTAEDTCACPGLATNWEVDLSDDCQITSNCNLSTGNITFINVGSVLFNATLTANKITWKDSVAVVEKYNLGSNFMGWVG